MASCDAFRPLPASRNFIEYDDVQSIIVNLQYVVGHHNRIKTAKPLSAAIARPFRAKLRRTFATVQDPPVRRYGGLKDQDRIFTNAYCRHDHGIKGAQVR